MKQQTLNHFIPSFCYFFLPLVICCCLGSCQNKAPKPPETVVVKNTEKIDEKTSEVLQQTLQYVTQHQGLLNDSVILLQPEMLEKIYVANNFQPIWSSEEKWNPVADSMYNFIYYSKNYGLFPSDYNLPALKAIKIGLASDTLHRRNAALWARADMMYTDAYLSIAKHLSVGRLNRDSVTLRSDSGYTENFYLRNFQDAIAQKNIRGTLEQLEPKLNGYKEIKDAIKSFLDSAVFKKTTYILYPNKDSLAMMQQVEKRLNELGLLQLPANTQTLTESIRSYQKQKGIPVTGKIGEKTSSSLNNNDWERFKRIAVNIDRYKMLPDSLPAQYIWVNLAGFYMQLWNADTIALESKVVVGKPLTRTPLLTSKITDMVTYPQWTIPESIILKEVLPGLKKDTNYLRKKGFSLIDSKGEEVYASSVNWSKYTKGIPYKVVQGSGDDNALGVLKFNFSNKYSVYMHDTNQRYYFSKTFRALSHGCVRVQQWEKLAQFIIKNDSLNASVKAIPFKSDSLQAWLKRKEKHVIPVKTRIPVFIRYFGCEGQKGKMKFYEDIYGEDKMLTERFFSKKPVD
jgi:murein L,D-transpeptidase YcbB/YkuD